MTSFLNMITYIEDKNDSFQAFGKDINRPLH